MRTRRVVAALVAVISLVLLQAPAGARTLPSAGRLGAAIDVRMRHAPAHVLVELRGGVAVESVTAGGARIFGRWYRAPVRLGETPIQAVRRLAAVPGVALAELDYFVRVDPGELASLDGGSPASVTPNDPWYSFQWNFPPVQAPDAWAVSTGSGIVVAVVDTGISQAGEDLKCQTFVAPFNAITDTPGSAVDDEGHGTHVAGTIAECTNNSLGVAGIAYGAKLMPIKVLDATGGGYSSDIAQGIDWARTNGAQVINLSLGVTCTTTWPGCSSSILDTAIDAATSAGIVVVAASGNGSSPYVSTPANNPNVISVGAVQYDLKRPSYSNYGTGLDIVAPGGSFLDQNGDGDIDGILQETFGDSGWGYYYGVGTSMAAPHVTAAVAMLKAAHPTATREQITAALLATGQDLGTAGYDDFYGNGLLQINSALTALANPSPVTITSFAPTSGSVGTVVVITGTVFTGATAVMFNEVPASFTVDSDTQITATVPEGATSGPITVNAPAGIGISSSHFAVPQPAPQVTGTLRGFYDTKGRYHLYRVGRDVPYSGRVVPNMAGQELFFELQVLKTNGWKRVDGLAHFTLSSGSAAAVSIQASVLKKNGRYRIRCFMPAVGDRLEGTSAWSYFMSKG